MAVRSRSRRRRGELRREDWIAAAREILIDGGIGTLSLRKLSDSLNVTTGAFYSLFQSLEALHEALREEWVRQNTDPFTRAIDAAGSDGMRQYLAYVRVLVLEAEFDPDFDNAIRDWAHSSPQTADILRGIESFRIEQLRRIFVALGFGEKSAMIRARVTYFHQVGYNAMQIRESLDERLLNIPYYAEVLTERRELLQCNSAEEVKRRLLEGTV